MTVRLTLNPRSFIPSGLGPIAKRIYYWFFRRQLIFRCWYEDWRMRKAGAPPALLRFRISEQISTSEFFRIGEGCFHLITNTLSPLGIDLARAERVLDFGCGCGRTLRWFLLDYPRVEFYGVDVDEEAIAWCQANLARGHFSANSPDPPLNFRDGYFDVVYCFSVFTHLDEAMQDRWLLELRRIMRPGGTLLITVHGQNAAKELDSEGKATLMAAGFVHRRSKKLKGLLPDWYQTTWHSQDYIVNRLSTQFSDVRYTVVPDGMQDIVTANRK